MKCKFINCLNEAGGHDYGSPYDNSCKNCIEEYFKFEAYLQGKKYNGFDPREYCGETYEERHPDL